MSRDTVGYIRAVRRARPSEAEQRAAIAAWATRHGEAVRVVHRDVPGQRGGLDALLLSVSAGRVARVVVARPCRLAPTLSVTLRALVRLRAAGVELVSADMDDPATMAALMAALPAIEAVRRGLRQEAADTGRARARARGVRLGRPALREDQIDKVAAALAQGASIREAARLGGVGTASAHRIKSGGLAGTRG